MDESGNNVPESPLIVGAIAVDAEFDAIEAEVRRLHGELSARRQLAGLESFERFRRNGFHAKDDLPDISVPFMELIQRTVGLKAYMLVTDRSGLPMLDERGLIEHLYVELLADIRAGYWRRASVECHIERGDYIRQLVTDLPRLTEIRAREKIGRVPLIAPLELTVVEKSEFMSLGIIDYIMMVTSRWIRKGCPSSSSDQVYRSFRAVEPKVSMLRSLESGVLAGRRIDLH